MDQAQIAPTPVTSDEDAPQIDVEAEVTNWLEAEGDRKRATRIVKKADERKKTAMGRLLAQFTVGEVFRAGVNRYFIKPAPRENVSYKGAFDAIYAIADAEMRDVMDRAKRNNTTPSCGYSIELHEN